MASTTGNGNLVHVERDSNRVLVQAINNTSFILDAGVQVNDLDARFSIAALTTSAGVWTLSSTGTWYPLQVSMPPSGTPISTAIYQVNGSTRLASFWLASAQVGVAGAASTATGFSLDTTATSIGTLGPIVGRPTETGDAGLVASSSQLVRVDSFSSSSSLFPNAGGAQDLRVASSEAQVSVLAWRQLTASRQAAWFWSPGSQRTFPSQPDLLLEGSAGIPTLHALATNGTWTAAVIGPTATSTFWIDGNSDGGVSVGNGQMMLLTSSATGPVTIHNLGTGVLSPIALSAGVLPDAGASGNRICRQDGGVIDFLPVP